MQKLFLIIGLFSLFSCGGLKGPGNSDKFIVENLAGSTSKEIKERYSEANIEEGRGMFEEATVERPFTILFPNTPDEIHITWKDEDRSQIRDIRISENGKWESEEGLEIGMTYDELNRMNGEEISFYGFGWDYSGAVMWNNGKFENTNLRVFLAPEDQPENKFIGDHIVEASREEINDLDLRVKTIIYREED